MKPLKLTMQAFGPYAEREVIDYRQLGNRTMFVISGKTGSGKTTIFDGISFAIYGKASGEDRTPMELRSQFASDDDMTEVELLFSLRGKTYRIWRSPQQEKKKARGEGFTTINARAELYTYNDEGEEQLLAANVREVDEKVKGLIQLDANQFRQILMIPQGEFRKLLTSDSKDKELILQRLFHTQLYKLIQEGLKSEADSLRKSVEASVETRTRELIRIHPAENEELKGLLLEEPLNDNKILTVLPSHIEEMEIRLKEMQEQYQEIQNKRDDLNKQLAEANNLMEQFRYRDKLSADLSSLEERKPEIEAVKKEIELAHKASILTKQDEYCHKLNRVLKEFTTELEQLKTEELKIAEKTKLAKKRYQDESAKEELREELNRKINHLETIQKDVYSLTALQSELKEIQEKSEKKVRAIDKQSEQIKFLKDGIAMRENRIEKLEDVQSQLYSFEKSLRENDALLSVLNEIEVYSGRLKESEANASAMNKKWLAIGKRVKDASDSLLYLENEWRSAQSAILARDLKDGEPCPVCGSHDHPNKALDTHHLPSEEDMNSARETLQSLQSEEKQMSVALAQEETKVEGLQEQLETLLNRAQQSVNITHDNYKQVIEEIRLQAKRLQANIAEKTKEVEELKKMKEEVRKGKEKLTELEEASRILQEEQQEMHLSFITKKTSLDKVRESIPSELNSKDDFDTLLKETQNTLAKMKADFEQAQSHLFACEKEQSVIVSQVKEKSLQVEKAEADMKQERDSFLSLLTEQGFSNYRAFTEAKKSEEEMNLLENKVKKHGEELRSVKDRLSDVTKQLENKEKPEIVSIEEALKSVTETMKNTNEELNLIRSQTEENKNILSRVTEINTQMKDLEQAYQAVGHLADIARGQNTNRITFERYVLASFLEDILRIANERLIKMTSGRYNLIRKTDRSKGNVQSGLELLVFDQYTGQERHVKTLSGGESFKASLALALGLADVVQQYAGGVSLETMFIDEGFGTLDPESLDHAIEALMDIQSSGRLVGLISHVPELKERIDARLEVISSKSGSRTEFQFMA
ncbi:SMC family ATPase [Rossellomorea aquimaris]|uniref:AAA family ATPase n=1 Tax=Rossellomorea aquimaris TaxID=189382 RepID=UPI001CD5BFA7|nr:SMC family ATPase [Rossellomorea aquimaris]MCA1053655.1 SMC family ATPase [Rossellomorea aquimaris]